MQIHELNTFSGTPGASDYFATDNGTDTSKISATNLYAPLNARIDNIIAGPASSAEEVIDARLGANGVPYASLGGAIRSQVAGLDSAINLAKTHLDPSAKNTVGSWVIGNLNASGKIDSMNSRISTNDFLEYDCPITIANKNTPVYTIVCTYDSSFSLVSRTLYYERTIAISANTKFRMTVYNSTSPVADINALANNVLVIEEKQINGDISSINLEALGTGKLMLPSDWTFGNLDANGKYSAVDAYLTKRITFYQYMKYATNILLHVDFPYNFVVCTYNSDLTLASRTLYGAHQTPTVVIPANTLFRVLIYIRDSSSDITDPAPIVKGIYTLANPNALPNLISIMESFAVIGDSLSCGFVGSAHGNISSNVAREAGRNWVNYLSLDINRPFTNLARGSSTAHDWRYGNTPLDVDISTADIETYCYMVAIGVNDARQNLTVGTSADIVSDKANNADSFYGNYDFIVRQLIEYKNSHLQQAKIFVFTMPPTESNAEAYNTAIRYIATLYDEVQCVDLYNLYYNDFLNFPFSKTWGYGHSRPVGYMMLAQMIRCGVNLCIIDNISKFLFTPWMPIS